MSVGTNIDCLIRLSFMAVT